MANLVLLDKEKSLKPLKFQALYVIGIVFNLAGAVGLEPTARGFGVDMYQTL